MAKQDKQVASEMAKQDKQVTSEMADEIGSPAKYI